MLHTPILILLIGSSGLIWTSLYFMVRKLTRNQQAEFSNRIITSIHGLFMSVHGVRECFIKGWAFNRDDNLTTNGLQHVVMLTSVGYFVFDLGWCLYYKTETNIMIAHHFYSIFALERILYKEIRGNETICALGIMEITNPLLQARWFIRTCGHHHSKWFMAVELSFIFMFILLRIFFGTVIEFQILQSQNYDWEFKLLGMVIYVVSWIFAVNMLKYFLGKYKYNEQPITDQ